jgi:hypothetical protein
MEFMGLVVYPKMKALFQAQDPKAYARFRCQTCHGEDMEAVDFRMPSSLSALPESDPIAAARARDENTTEFMVDKVEPVMKTLLGENDADTAGRVACGSCHPRE